MNEQEIEENRKEAMRDVKLWLSNGYDLKEETPEYFVLTKNKASMAGHILIILCTGWFSFGLVNLIYHFLSVDKKRILK